MGSLLRRLIKRLLTLVLGLVALSVVVVVLLRWTAPPATAFMLMQPGSIYDIAHLWRDRAEISPNLAWAVIASEDQKFLTHHGFDIESIQDAIDEYRSGEDLRGASTITQQVAKNVFLWPERSLLRKGLEAYFTVLIELCWSKERILEVYLNVAEFGEGVFGAEAAARRFFDSSAAEVSSAQAALLAAVLPSPKRFDLRSPTPYLRGRQAWILTQMGRVRASSGALSWD